MKIQIRRGVFETNSSSTHSLQLIDGDVDVARDIVAERIRKAYENDPIQEPFSIDDYIDNDTKTLYLKGLEITDGCEEANVYYIIKNWLAKLQFLSMYIYYHISYFSDYDKETDKLRSWNDDKTDLIEKTSIIKWFKEEVIKYANIHNITINNVVFDVKHESWVEGIYGCKNPFDYREYVMSLDDMKNMVNKVMDENFTLAYMDEAYHPYESPDITVID